MLSWFIQLDPTVQVAIIGPMVAAFVAFPAWIVTITKPKSAKEEEVYKPKPMVVQLAVEDRMVIEKFILYLDNHTNAIERHTMVLSNHARVIPQN